jgi:hypothetical protein
LFKDAFATRGHEKITQFSIFVGKSTPEGNDKSSQLFFFDSGKADEKVLRIPGEPSQASVRSSTWIFRRSERLNVKIWDGS